MPLSLSQEKPGILGSEKFFLSSSKNNLASYPSEANSTEGHAPLREEEDKYSLTWG
jgi:hypothetical protein